MSFTIVNSVTLLFISSTTTLFFVQIFKTVLNSILIGKIDNKTIFSDGDFPSSHTAVLISCNIVIWHLIYSYAINNPKVDMFASVLVGFVLALWSCYVIRDAMGVRLRVQEHAVAIKLIAKSSKELSEKLENLNLTDSDINSNALQEELDDLLKNIKLKAGHLPHEVLGGIVTGGLIGCIFISIADSNFKMFFVIFAVFVLYVTLTIRIFIKKSKKIKAKLNS